jgi:energy-coupling factor transporter ATP-binding protein EcfA2
VVVARSRAYLRNLRISLDLISSRSNPVFWLFVHAILPFDTLLCLATWLSINRISGRFTQLTNGLVEFDCDAALSRFWNENPEFTFSEFILTGGAPLGSAMVTAATRAPSVDGRCLLEASHMGHPLLPRKSRVTNSVQWTAADRLVLLTGSNMSGKSTFLRTIGINAILHNIGAPVCATQFRAPVLQLLCAIRVDDALEAGTSYFYAEVKRLAALLRNVTQAESSGSREDSLPLYLIDEIFRGTNNRERFLGSLYVIRGFLETSSIGIVTTHDLSLTQLQQMDSVGRVRNMHFRETVESARLQFDYMLRSGPCPTTNALRIMHAEGLPVPAEISEVDEAALVRVMQVQPSPMP